MPVCEHSFSETARSSVHPWNMVRNLWRYRELIYQFTMRDVQQRYRGSYLGFAWAILVPLLMLCIFTFVFSVIFQARWGVSQQGSRLGEFALTLFAGLIPFSVFSEVVNRAPSLILGVPNYVKRVVFPLEIMPVAAVGSALIHSLISVVILLIGTAVVFKRLSPTLFLLPLSYVPLILLCLGLGWFLASLGVYVRDIREGVSIAVQALFFLSPVFYPVTAVPEGLRTVFYLNPLTTILSGFRRSLIWGQLLPWAAWAGWTAIAAVIAWLGYAWFMKTKKGFADVM